MALNANKYKIALALNHRRITFTSDIQIVTIVLLKMFDKFWYLLVISLCFTSLENSRDTQIKYKVRVLNLFRYVSSNYHF
jgi:hypothetical protein